MSKWSSFLTFLGLAWMAVGCGDVRTLGPAYVDSTVGSSLPSFVVFVYSDLQSNFRQALPPARNPSTSNLVYYFTNTPNYLKNCAVYQNQVDVVTGYHSGNAAESDCTSLGGLLNSEGVFPAPQSELDQSEAAVNMGREGFVYAYFFYYPNSTSLAGGNDISPNTVVPSNNRCFKLWAAQMKNGVLVGKNDAATSTVDLKLLKCYGF